MLLAHFNSYISFDLGKRSMMKTLSCPHRNLGDMEGWLVWWEEIWILVQISFEWWDPNCDIRGAKWASTMYWCVYASTWHYKTEIFDEILEIIQTFRSGLLLFIVWDMNSSMMERFGNDRGKILERLISENSLINSQDGTCSYIHYNWVWLHILIRGWRQPSR